MAHLTDTNDRQQNGARTRNGGIENGGKSVGPYRGYYISASARLVQSQEGDAEPIYVGSVSLAPGADDVHRFEALRRSGPGTALAYVEESARE